MEDCLKKISQGGVKSDSFCGHVGNHFNIVFSNHKKIFLHKGCSASEVSHLQENDLTFDKRGPFCKMCALTAIKTIMNPTYTSFTEDNFDNEECQFLWVFEKNGDSSETDVSDRFFKDFETPHIFDHIKKVFRPNEKLFDGQFLFELDDNPRFGGDGVSRRFQ